MSAWWLRDLLILLVFDVVSGVAVVASEGYAGGFVVCCVGLVSEGDH